MDPRWSWSRKSCLLVPIFLLLVVEVRAQMFGHNQQQPSKVFDVTKFGADGNGQTDNSKVFLDTFNLACREDGHSQIVIPKGTFLVESAVFKGPCKGPIDFQVSGTVKAPAGLVGKDKWITFRHIDRLTISGSGTFDGQGGTAWPYNDCNKNPKCQPLPISIRLDYVTNSVVRDITSLNSKNFHMNIFSCNNIKIEGVKIIAPEASPNTDGIHMGDSRDIRISNSNIATGDDCVSIGPGSHNIEVHHVKCGPGHGISIGSLGKYPNESDVSGIVVKTCELDGTDNGLRIKTWASPLKSKVYNISYDDVLMKNVRKPITIDQLYCPTGNCDKKKASSVQIQDVWFNNIRGSSKTRDAVSLNCSSQYPCKNINLKDIDLSYDGKDGPAKSACSNVSGSASGTQKPEACVR